MRRVQGCAAAAFVSARKRADRPYRAPVAHADHGLMLQDDAFRTLDRQECLRLLAKVPVGRVVYTRQALPAVLPINFALDEDASVLLFTSAGSDLVRAIDGVVVAFEADEF